MFRNCIVVLLCTASFLLCLASHTFLRRHFELSDGWSAVWALPLAVAHGLFCGFLVKRMNAGQRRGA